MLGSKVYHLGAKHLLLFMTCLLQKICHLRKGDMNVWFTS